MAPYQAFQTQDGWINIGAANQSNWEKLINALNAETLGEDERFIDNAGRLTNLPLLVEELTPYFRTRTTAEWLEIFDTVVLPVGPVLSIGEVHAGPQTVARNMVVDVEHTRLGTIKNVGAPVKFSQTPEPESVRRGALLLGEHMREVLLEYGFAEQQIEALATAGDILTKE